MMQQGNTGLGSLNGADATSPPLHRDKWLPPYLSWERLLEYKDEKLTERHRLIFWLCKLWEKHEELAGVDASMEIPYIYDELLKRYVRDYSKPEKWCVDGKQEEAVTKWRNLQPGYHEDQVALCEFYASVDVSLAIKGLETGGLPYTWRGCLCCCVPLGGCQIL